MTFVYGEAMADEYVFEVSFTGRMVIALPADMAAKDILAFLVRWDGPEFAKLYATYGRGNVQVDKLHAFTVQAQPGGGPDIDG